MKFSLYIDVLYRPDLSDLPTRTPKQKAAFKKACRPDPTLGDDRIVIHGLSANALPRIGESLTIAGEEDVRVVDVRHCLRGIDACGGQNPDTFTHSVKAEMVIPDSKDVRDHLREQLETLRIRFEQCGVSATDNPRTLRSTLLGSVPGGRASG